MHKLDRVAVQRPACLDHHNWKTKTWNEFTSQAHECKRTVRLALQRIQGPQIATNDDDDEAYVVIGLRCAYCESQVYHRSHIEHFRRKDQAHYPELTFEWTNLFIACGSNEHCGHYKDRLNAPDYEPDNLIKPDEHNPDEYLYFHSSGEVRVRHRVGMTNDDRHRGAETIRVFHLDCGRLKGARRKALNQYLDSNTGILEALMDCDEHERQVFIGDEIEATKSEPFGTTIRHFFEKAI